MSLTEASEMGATHLPKLHLGPSVWTNKHFSLFQDLQSMFYLSDIHKFIAHDARKDYRDAILPQHEAENFALVSLTSFIICSVFVRKVSDFTFKNSPRIYSTYCLVGCRFFCLFGVFCLSLLLLFCFVPPPYSGIIIIHYQVLVGAA